MALVYDWLEKSSLQRPREMGAWKKTEDAATLGNAAFRDVVDAAAAAAECVAVAIHAQTRCEFRPSQQEGRRNLR